MNNVVPKPEDSMNNVVPKPEDGRPVCKHCKKPVDQAHHESHLSICLENKKDIAKRKKERKEARKKENEKIEKDKERESGGIVAKTGTATSSSGNADQKSDRSAINGPKTGIAVPKDPQIGNPKKDEIGHNLDGSTGKGSQGIKKVPEKSGLGGKADVESSAKKLKKRKVEEEAATSVPADRDRDQPKKKKLKKDDPPKPKAIKPRGPVNVEVQCGVPLEKERGGFCARSLTCKSHSMGLKRAVPGRSLPYDQLLAMYQKKNQARQQKALIEAQANAQLDEEAENGAIDSEEEQHAVMAGLARWRPAPVEQIVTVPIGRRYEYIRFKEMLGNALSSSSNTASGKNLFSVPSDIRVAMDHELQSDPANLPSSDHADSPAENLPNTAPMSGKKSSAVG